MIEGLYVGEVFHRRYSTPEHDLRYKVAMPLLLLEDVETRTRKLIKESKLSPLLNFRREDYLSNLEGPISSAVKTVANKSLGFEPSGTGYVLTNWRQFGWLFNPISLYFFTTNDTNVEAVVMEVSNTPWHERYIYAYSGNEEELKKSFHVSPFIGLNKVYKATLNIGEKHLFFSIEVNGNNAKTLFTSVSLYHACSPTEMPKALVFRHPWSTVKVSYGIYKNALKLYLKGAQFNKHPKVYQ